MSIKKESLFRHINQLKDDKPVTLSDFDLVSRYCYLLQVYDNPVYDFLEKEERDTFLYYLAKYAKYVYNKFKDNNTCRISRTTINCDDGNAEYILFCDLNDTWSVLVKAKFRYNSNYSIYVKNFVLKEDADCFFEQAKHSVNYIIY